MPEKFNLKQLLAEIKDEHRDDEKKRGTLTQGEIRVLFAKKRSGSGRHAGKRGRVS